MPKKPVGIDLFVCRCIEGGNNCHVSASIANETAASARLGVGACSGFGRFGSERVFRNEFPYLGRVDPAAWADLSPVGGLGIVGNVDRFGRAGPAARAGPRGSQSCASSRACRSESACSGSEGGPQGPR